MATSNDSTTSSPQHDNNSIEQIAIAALRKIAEYDSLCIWGSAEVQESTALAYSQLAEIAKDALAEIEDAAPELPTIYRYGMRNRPAMFATVPNGWRAGADHPDFIYGTVEYDSSLSPKDLYRYEMVLLEPLPDMPVYPVGSSVKKSNTGKVYEVEFNDGEYWIGDEPLPTDATWRAVAKWHQFAPAEVQS